MPRIWDLSAGQSMIVRFVMIFRLDGESLPRPGVDAGFTYPTGSPDVGGAAGGDCMFTQEEAQKLTGATAYDQAGQKIGQVATLYQDNATGGEAYSPDTPTRPPDPVSDRAASKVARSGPRASPAP